MIPCDFWTLDSPDSPSIPQDYRPPRAPVDIIPDIPCSSIPIPGPGIVDNYRSIHQSDSSAIRDSYSNESVSFFVEDAKKYEAYLENSSPISSACSSPNNSPNSSPVFGHNPQSLHSSDSEECLSNQIHAVDSFSDLFPNSDREKDDSNQ